LVVVCVSKRGREQTNRVRKKRGRQRAAVERRADESEEAVAFSSFFQKI
jgi:hypothetical protein